MNTEMEHITSLSKSVFTGSFACLGCGTMLGLKLALQVINNSILVNSTGCITLTGEHVKVPFVHAGTNAAAVARGIYNAMHVENADMEKETKIVVFAGDKATRTNLSSLVAANEDIIYICYNKYGLYNSERGNLDQHIAKQLALTTGYVATASIAFPNDFIRKLEKAKKRRGLKFIEILSPCPIDMGFDTSNTIEISRLAVETGLWPLYEIEKRSVNVTKRPVRLEPIERFFELQKMFKPSEEQIASMQLKVNKNWKVLTDGRIL